MIWLEVVAVQVQLEFSPAEIEIGVHVGEVVSRMSMLLLLELFQLKGRLITIWPPAGTVLLGAILTLIVPRVLTMLGLNSIEQSECNHKYLREGPRKCSMMWLHCFEREHCLKALEWCTRTWGILRRQG